MHLNGWQTNLSGLFNSTMENYIYNPLLEMEEKKTTDERYSKRSYFNSSSEYVKPSRSRNKKAKQKKSQKYDSNYDSRYY